MATNKLRETIVYGGRTYVPGEEDDLELALGKDTAARDYLKRQGLYDRTINTPTTQQAAINAALGQAVVTDPKILELADKASQEVRQRVLQEAMEQMRANTRAISDATRDPNVATANAPEGGQPTGGTPTVGLDAGADNPQANGPKQ